MARPPSDDTPAAPLSIADPGNRPSTRAPYAWALNTALWGAPITALFFWLIGAGPLGGRLGPAVVTALVVVFAAAAVVGLIVMPLWRYRVHRWEIGPTAIHTRTGWLSQERRIAPISRIQTVDTQRGPVEQLLGLSTVTITTASSAGKVRIQALDKPVADAVAEHLAAVVGELVDDAT